MSGKWETVPLISTRHPVIVHLVRDWPQLTARQHSVERQRRRVLV
jgi:hypothetical protein